MTQDRSVDHDMYIQGKPAGRLWKTLRKAHAIDWDEHDKEAAIVCKALTADAKLVIDCIVNNWITNRPRGPLGDMVNDLEVLAALNRVLAYYGAEPVTLEAYGKLP